MNAIAIDTHNIVSSTEAVSILTKSVETLIANPDLAGSLPAIIFKGAPGCGKSTIVRDVAKSLNIGFIDVRLAQMERCDFAGLPSVNDGVTTWNVPEFWPRDPNSRGIIFFDEITAAASDVQVAAYSLILDRKIPNSGYSLPKGWYIVAAGNRKEDHSVAKTMSAALANRFVHFEIEANAEEWGEWAISHDIHPSVTGFINYRPNLLFKMKDQNLEMGWPSPRSWERVSQMIPLFGDNEDVLRKVVYGLVGNQAGVEFTEFHRINSKFDDVLEMLTNPEAEIRIPEKSDQKYALCSAVAYLLWNGKNEEEHTLRISGMYRIAMKLTADFATLLAKSCMLGNSKIPRFQASMLIMKNPGYKKFAEKFGEAFTKKYTISE